jgi:predicted nicotinamide N-methyase
MCRFAVKTFDVRVADLRWRLCGPADPDAMLDEPGLEDAFKADGYLPYWADLWPASIMLAEHLLNRPADGGSGPVLELGCGLGLAGLAAAATGRSVHFTDYEPMAPAFAAANARRNGFHDIDAYLLDFRAPPERRYPLIVAADILYETGLRQIVPELLRRLLPAGGRALLADPDRPAVVSMLSASRLPGLVVAARRAVTTTSGGRTVEGTVWEFVRE